MKYCPICDQKYEDEVRVCESAEPFLEQWVDGKIPILDKRSKGRCHISKLGQGWMNCLSRGAGNRREESSIKDLARHLRHR